MASVIPRSPPAPDAERPDGPPAPPPAFERLNLEPYVGPKSHHASRAFAEMQERTQKRLRAKKLGVVLAVVVVGGTLAWVALRLLGA